MIHNQTPTSLSEKSWGSQPLMCWRNSATSGYFSGKRVASLDGHANYCKSIYQVERWDEDAKYNNAGIQRLRTSANEANESLLRTQQRLEWKCFRAFRRNDAAAQWFCTWANHPMPRPPAMASFLAPSQGKQPWDLNHPTDVLWQQWFTITWPNDPVYHHRSAGKSACAQPLPRPSTHLLRLSHSDFLP